MNSRLLIKLIKYDSKGEGTEEDKKSFWRMKPVFTGRYGSAFVTKQGTLLIPGDETATDVLLLFLYEQYGDAKGWRGNKTIPYQ